eukprot:scaffold348578_cov21-Prasinocladus_malaysianus.AAC.1
MKIVLTYFNDGKGRSELPRLCLKYGEVEFDDERIPYDEYKRRRAARVLPLGQLPVLEVDGTVIAQSCAIARWCAAHVGLLPSSPLLVAKVDMVSSTM